MRPSPHAPLVSVDIPVRLHDLVGAWRPELRRLTLPTHAALRLQQRIAARVSAIGSGIAATITGRVVSTRRDGNLHRIEIVPDEARVRAVERLVEVARGREVVYPARAPRFLATLPAVVAHARVPPTYMTTFSVSENGCGLLWSGAVPVVGAPIELRLGASRFAAILRAVVCWTGQSGHAPTVGVRFVDGARSGWAMILADVKRSGAPLA